MKRYTRFIEINNFSKMSKEELEDLKQKIKSQPFLSPQDIRDIKEIDSIITGFDVDDIKFGKFKKSRRVTSFNRNRS